MNSDNSKTSDPYRPILNLSDKINSKKECKHIAWSMLNIYYTWANIKASYKNNEFKISALTWKDKFELLWGSYSVSDIQDYFEYAITEVASAHCNIVNNGYQQELRVLHTFVPNKSFEKLTEILPTNFYVF